MLTVICGEDTVSSRDYLNRLRKEYADRGVEIRDIAPSEIHDIGKWLGDSMNLFSSKTVFITEHLEPLIVRKRGKKSSKPSGTPTYEDAATTIAKKRDIELIDWENKAGRDIKLKNIAQVKEFKPSSTVFKLLDACYPGNLQQFVEVLRKLVQDQDDTFLFIMLYRHIKTLILACDNVFSKTCPPWQKYKLTAQAKQWKQEKLVEFYEGLYRIETSTKSGTNPHGAGKTLEILACYYL